MQLNRVMIHVQRGINREAWRTLTPFRNVHEWMCDEQVKELWRACITVVNLRLGRPRNPKKIITSSCRFLHSMLQCQPYDVGKPLTLLNNVM